MSLADKVTTGTYSFVSLIVKVILALSALVISLSLPASDKTQYFVHLSLKSTLQLINSVSSDHQELLEYSNGTAIVAFLRIPLAAFGAG